MNCDCTEKISLLIDGELPAVEASEVERHLLECVECQQARNDFLNLRSQMSAYVADLSPAAQRNALSKILSQQEAATVPSRTRVVRGRRLNWTSLNWGFNPGWVAAAGLILVGSLFVLVFYLNSRHRSADLPSPQATSNRPTPVSPTDVQTPKPGPTESVANNESTVVPPGKISVVVKPERHKVASRSPKLDEVPAIDLATQGNSSASAGTQVRSGDAETMTAMHLEKSELLLRAFRNVRATGNGRAAEIGYERQRAQQLVYQNIMLRREADTTGDVQVATLLESLEPILLDIANLPQHPEDADIRAIQQRVERKNIVALLQVNSTALARALD
jgi:negative regulator of sigma E activity